MSTIHTRTAGDFTTPWILAVGTLTAVFAAVAYPYGWYAGWVPAAVGVLGGGLIALTGYLRGHAGNVLIYRASSWLAFGAWASAANALGMSLMMFLVLGAVVLVLSLLMPLFNPDAPALAGADPAEGLTTGIALDWKRRIDNICRVTAPGVTITAKDDWENGTGFTLTVEGPPGSGFTFRTLTEELARLGAAAKLKPGCALQAREGDDHQGQAYMDVPTVYELATTRTYPQNYSPLTVNGMIPIGIFPDGSEVLIEIREGSMLVIGRKGGGKTTLLWDITASIGRCTDALIWHIDMNNGGMSAPWLVPWLEEKCEIPVIDWFAFNEEEALLMSRVGLAIALHRKMVYARRKTRANATLLPLGDDLPEIFIMIDEAAEVLGEDSDCLELGENIRKIMRLGRDSGVNVLISALRPVGDHLPVQVRKNCTTRIGMRVEEKDEYDYTFENARGCEPHMIKHKGEGFIFRGEIDSAPAKWRSFNMLPEQIEQVSIATSDLHPELDAKSLPEKFVEVYAQRWDRAAPYLNAMMDDDEPVAAAPVVEAPAPTAGREPEARTVATKPDDMEASFLAYLDTLPVAEADRPNRGATRTLGEGAQLVVGIVTEPMMMAQILGEVDAAGRNVTRQTVNEWVSEAIASERLERGTKKGQYQPAGWTGPEEAEGQAA
jgi:hypothetical protein